MPAPEEIWSQKIVLMEGKDAEFFFKELCKHIEKNDLQIMNYGGINELRGFLKTLKGSPGYRTIESIGIIRDAELKMESAFQSVCDALKANGFAVPSRPNQVVTGKPNISVFILPDCKNPGMLETLCWKAVEEAHDPAIQCVYQYLNCLSREEVSPQNEDKARLHAFLASRKEPGLLVGQATQRGYWDLYSSVFEPLRSFFKAL